jgi:ABC-type Fe3+-hydroxamate transport system substrate-binding protein
MTALCLVSCGPGGGSTDGTPDLSGSDTALVVMGPSLVELFFHSGEGWRVAGVDRYTLWPPEADSLPEVGGYLDASYESIAALDPTSLHTVGESPDLAEIAAELGIPYHGYSFDTLEDVFQAARRIEELYGTPETGFGDELLATLDSLRVVVGGSAPGVMLVVFHQTGSGTMTLAGRDTFLGDLVAAMGCSLSAPAHGTYPSVSVEGVLDLSPERIVCLYPDAPDTQSVREMELEFWSRFGYGPDRVRVLFQDYLLIPGARLGMTAERISECLR